MNFLSFLPPHGTEWKVKTMGEVSSNIALAEPRQVVFCAVVLPFLSFFQL
jgi:hypothetical protein